MAVPRLGHVSQLGAQWNDKKGADGGIDGRVYFHAKDGEAHRQILIPVKGRAVTLSRVRDLRGAMDREKADIGVMLAAEAFTKSMRAEAASAGFLTTPWGKHPKMQLITVAQLLART